MITVILIITAILLVLSLVTTATLFYTVVTDDRGDDKIALLFGSMATTALFLIAFGVLGLLAEEIWS